MRGPAGFNGLTARQGKDSCFIFNPTLVSNYVVLRGSISQDTTLLSNLVASSFIFGINQLNKFGFRRLHSTSSRTERRTHPNRLPPT